MAAWLQSNSLERLLGYRVIALSGCLVTGLQGLFWGGNFSTVRSLHIALHHKGRGDTPGTPLTDKKNPFI
jgi:hypothetical protein